MPFITQLLDAVWELAADALAVVWNWITQMISSGVDVLLGLLPAELVATMQQAPWDQWGQYWDLVSYFVPVYGIVAILGGAYSVVGGLRLVKLVVSFIPTVGGS